MKGNYFTKIIILLLVVTTTLVWSIMSSAGENSANSTSAPVINTFELGSDNLGAINSSVNLYSGDVNLPLNMFSLPGRGGLDVNVSIIYNSNIQNIVDTWNLEAPTGILGLGWSMDYEKIVVDHKNTGSRHDDDFYLIAGGASNLLVRTGTEGAANVYETKTYQFWKIRFYPNEERWEIIKENGIAYEYGDKNSGRNTVQWGVKWGNWIGNSSESTGQERFVLVYNISKISNVWGDAITFNYDSVNQYVGSIFGQYHTEASYLQEITDVLGRKVVYTYGEKYGALNPDPNGKIEYEEPHTEVVEPDAYQERYETKYLDYIEVLDQNNNKIFSVHFGYGFIGTANLAKRLLTSIIHKNADDVALPSLQFEYNTNDPNKDALKKITFPQGGSATYIYSTKTISKSSRYKFISAPSGYSEPQTWISEDYVVVTWYNDVSDKIKVYAYYWDGEWVKTYLDEITNIDKVGVNQNFGIVLEKNFFAILDNFLDQDAYKNVYVYHKLNS